MDLDSEPDDNYELVIPKDIKKYISQIKSLIKYADKVIWNPNGDNPIKRLEEIADLNYYLTKNLKDIEKYMESNSWSYKTELNRLLGCLEGRLFMLKGQIPNLELLLK